MTEGIDLIILRVMAERTTFEKMYASMPVYALEEKTVLILKDMEGYFKEFPNHEALDPDTFATYFFTFCHPSMTKDVRGFYETLMRRMYVPVDDDTRAGLVDRILELEYATKVANICQKYDAGDDINIGRAIEEATETLQLQKERRVKMPWVNDSINDLLLMDEDQSGLTWRLPCLNKSMRPLRPGDFVVVAARPDAGKTTFLTDQLSFMAPQMADFYGEEKDILWFNNEGIGQRIVTRGYQSALNASIGDLIKLKKQGIIESEYAKMVGGLHRIKVMDIHDCWNYEVSDIIEQFNPGLIVFDMIDNIRFGGQAAGSRTDQALESMYQWARVKGVKCGCPILATSQISADGDGLQYPTLAMLKDSKTGKQGAADVIITLGKSNDPVLESSRFIGMTKNKLTIEGGAKDPRTEVLFDYIKGRYNELCN